ncbi:MAG: glycosyltransferase [Vicinamibacteria bacterium]|nr:glycosyltransferase [Vicinamibacteria bacterium]
MALRIAFVRPRLGVGGAERLVVDAARVLAERGHEVALFAPDRPSVPQFEDAVSPRFSWARDGAWIPESLLGRLRAPMAMIRAAAAGWFARGFSPDVVFADVTSHIVPWLSRVTRAPVVFYCHFPDALLTAEGARARPAYRSYRSRLDRMEARGLEAARVVLVNSAFTARRLAETFPELRVQTTVLAPGVDVSRHAVEPISDDGEIPVVTVSRFDPRKNLTLAVEAFAAARREAPAGPRSRMVLHIAGRHDDRWPECREALAHLKNIAAGLGIADAVRFHLSRGDAEVRALLAGSRVVLYTPRGEHFGYGPLEAMACARPVIAVNEGGPAETVVDGVTGFLRAPEVAAFAGALSLCVADPDLSRRLGLAGRDRAASRFSLEGFGRELEQVCLRVSGRS